MKITKLIIENFRGIARAEAAELGDTIIIAGQNGSGKSCLFDAIRLLKSTYGGYQQNEWQQFFGEFAIQLHGGAKNLRSMFNDPTKDLLISCLFELRDAEKAYISANAAELLESTIWQTLLPEAFQFGGYSKALFANQFRERQPEVTARVQNELPALLGELTANTVLGEISVSPTGAVVANNSRLLSIVFTNYRPHQIGVIDFHGAQRHYGREPVQGVNLNLDQANQQYSQHALYNYSNKYNNVKSEMAGNYVRELLADKATGGKRSSSSLSTTLQELFESFFPEKKFAGPTPRDDGSLAFPVITPSGHEHDLDELSSGEKEILYGYLRIRSSAPKNSIILLDEPELHLNPRLIRGLPEFYRKHLGEALQNQLWLVTHSDALIREAIGKPGFNVFHMLPCGSDRVQSSQLRPLKMNEDLELALSDLVGDLAAYRPGGKALIFEGGGDTDFDKMLATSLFREELAGINLISGSNKTKVRALHEVLDRAYKRGDLPTKFYAVVDRDFDQPVPETNAINRFTWDVYHIENYLIEANALAYVLNSVQMQVKYTADDAMKILQKAARRVVPALLTEHMRRHVNSILVRCIDLGFSPATPNISAELKKAAERSIERINDAATSILDESHLEEEEKKIREEIESCFGNGTWQTRIPGREMLKQLVTVAELPVGYEVFRNLLMRRMVEVGYKPLGMKKIIERICKD